MNLTRADVEEILKILDASTYDELELETDRFKLILRRGAGSGSWTQQRETKTTTQGVAAKAAATAVPAAAVDDGTLRVRAPLIGTFYRASKPGAPPYVEIGSRVTPETVVGIIETMKLMNSVYAGATGIVHAIDVADGEFVEQNHVLMRIAAPA